MSWEKRRGSKAWSSSPGGENKIRPKDLHGTKSSNTLRLREKLATTHVLKKKHQLSYDKRRKKTNSNTASGGLSVIDALSESQAKRKQEL